MSDQAATAPQVPATPPASGLLDFNTPPAAPQGQQPPAAAAPPAAEARVVEYKGEKLQVPENFWDPEANTVNIGALLKSQNDLRAQLGQQPKAPESYALTVPKDLEGKITANANDPLFQRVTALAKNHNLPQQALDDLVGAYFSQQVAEAEADQAYLAEQTQALDQALGPNPAQAKAELAQWAVGLFGQDHLADLQVLATSASGVLLLKKMKDLVKEPTIPGTRDAGGGGLTVTEDGLKQMMKDPRYWRDKDPAFIKQVTDGFAKLYPAG